MPRLSIEALDTRHPGLNEHAAGFLSDAARVCLHRHHRAPTEISIRNDEAVLTADIDWTEPDSRCLASHGNRDDATRDGACACVIAAVELTNGLVAIGRAQTKEGADYYVAPAGATVGDFEDAIRLEVSGLNEGQEHEVAARLNQKVVQARSGKSPLPAIAGVIGFRERLLLLKKAV